MPGKDLRTQKTDRAIRDAFFTLIEEKSLDHITVNEICRVAKVRRSTFYLHYQDKYDLFRHLFQELIDEFLGKNSDKYAQLSRGAFYTAVIEDFLEFLRQNHVLVNAVVWSNAYRELSDILFDQLLQTIQTQLKRIDYAASNTPIDEVVISQFFSGGVLRVVLNWLNNPTKSAAEIASQLNWLLTHFDPES